MSVLLWILIAFLSGALPFSVWIGKLALGQDIRDFGDGNPGMTNVFRAGGKGWGVLALLLDFLKGALPVGLARWEYGLDSWGLATVTVAPVLGHAFSPFLRFRGGKAVAVSFGIWSGLTLWQAPTLLGISVAVLLLVIGSEGWPIFPAMLVLLLYLIQGKAPLWMLVIWLSNFSIFLWKHRQELRQPPRLSLWLRRLLRLP